MGRGGGQQVLKNQQNLVNTAAATEGGEASDTFGTVNAADKAIIANPVSDKETQAITQNTLQPLAESFDASGQAAGNLAAKTRNTAGYQANLDKMAQQRGQQTAQTNQKLQEDLGNMAFNRKMAALNQQQGLFGTATGAQTANLGTGAKLAGDISQIQNQPGFWDTVGSSFARRLGGGNLFGSGDAGSVAGG